MKKNIFFLIVPIILAILMITCNKDDTSESTIPEVTGIAVDQTSQPLAGVKVSANGKTTTTAANGKFTISLSNANTNRVVLDLEMTGYYKASYGFVPSGGNNFVKIMLLRREIIGEINNANGGNASNMAGSLSVSYPPNSFVAEDGSTVTGSVKVFGTLIDPTNPDFGSMMPGGDFVAESSSGEKGVLFSYGAVVTEAETQDGKPLIMNTQAKALADVCLTIPPSMLENAPDSIPIWMLDPQTKQWKEGGYATKSGNRYCFKTGGLIFNCDLLSRSGLVRGRVCNDDKAIANVPVRIGQQITYTNNKGEFGALVPIGNSVLVSSEYGSKNINVTTGTNEIVGLGNCYGNQTGFFSFKGITYTVKNAYLYTEEGLAEVYLVNGTIDELDNGTAEGVYLELVWLSGNDVKGTYVYLDEEPVPGKRYWDEGGLDLINDSYDGEKGTVFFGEDFISFSIVMDDVSASVLVGQYGGNFQDIPDYKSSGKFKKLHHNKFK
jgi:hypothetical protein